MEVVAMTETRYGIVAGYDGSPGAAQALRWAAREAGARGTVLTVTLAWTPDHMELPTEPDLRAAVRRVGARPWPGPRGPGRWVGRPGAVRTRPGRRHGGDWQSRARRAARLAARVGRLAGGRARFGPRGRRPRRVAAR